MIDFNELDLYKLAGEQKRLALEALNNITKNKRVSPANKFKAYDIIYKDIARQEARLVNARQNILNKQKELQLIQIEQFKAVRIVRFMNKYAAMIATGSMTPEAAKEYKKIDDKYNNGCYSFAEDSITVYELECETCNKYKCKYHPEVKE